MERGRIDANVGNTTQLSEHAGAAVQRFVVVGVGRAQSKDMLELTDGDVGCALEFLL